jgi:lipoprotein-releasing system permease protein
MSDTAESAKSSGGAFSPFEWMVALRYVRARRADGFVSVIAGFSFLGIMLGVATLIVVTSVMNGFHRELMDKIMGVNGHAFLQAVETPFTDWDDLSARTEKVSGVKLAIPMVEGAAGISTQFGQSGVLVRGVREKDLVRLPGIAGNVKIGALAGFDKGEGVAIGQRLAETLGVTVGDKVSLLIAKGAQTPFGVAPRIKAYAVSAIFSIGMSEFDNVFVYMPLAEAQSFFNKEKEATVVEIFVEDPEQMDLFRARFEKAVTRPVIITDWRQRNKTFFDTLQVEKNILFIILTLIVIVAAFNIISGLTMLVKDKTQDIAILRTMGASRGAVLRVFLIIGASIGVVGTIAGFLLGLLIAENLDTIRVFLNKAFDANLFPAEFYFLSRLPAIVDTREVTVIVVMTLVIAVLASIFPAWKAASLDPIEALRHE